MLTKGTDPDLGRQRCSYSSLASPRRLISHGVVERHQSESQKVRSFSFLNFTPMCMYLRAHMWVYAHPYIHKMHTKQTAIHRLVDYYTRVTTQSAHTHARKNVTPGSPLHIDRHIYTSVHKHMFPVHSGCFSP